MNKNLTWKVLLPVGFAGWLLARLFGDIVAIQIIGVCSDIILVIGLIDFFRHLFRKKDKKPAYEVSQ